MFQVQKPLPFADLNAKPEIPPFTKVSDDVQQSLALLSAFDGQQRRLVGVSRSGALKVVSPRLRDIINITGSGAGDTWQGDRIECSEVIVIGHPDNGGRIWWNVDAAAAVDTGAYVDAGDHYRFTITNLNNLHLYFVVDGDKAIVLYCE